MRVDQILTEAELAELGIGRMLGKGARSVGSVVGKIPGAAADVAGSVAGLGSAFMQGYRSSLAPKPKVAAPPKEPSLFQQRYQQAKANIANPDDTTADPAANRVEPTMATPEPQAAPQAAPSPAPKPVGLNPQPNVKINYYGHSTDNSNLQDNPTTITSGPTPTKPTPAKGMQNVQIDPKTGKPITPNTRVTSRGTQGVPLKSMNTQIDPATGRYRNTPSESLERIIQLSKR